MEIKVGADPELFVLDNTGKFISAVGLVPGTKEKPHPVNMGAVQVDGMALEFNIEPATSCDQFISNVDTVLTQLKNMIPGHLSTSDKVTAEFAMDYMAAQDETTLAIGCDPDYNGYNEEQNKSPVSDIYIPRRWAGGHVHVGWGEGMDVNDQVHFSACAQLARHLDLYLAIPSLLLDEDVERKNYYGKAGSFRPKSYGMEYRTLSNFWINDKALMKFVFEQTVDAIKDLMAGGKAGKKFGDIRQHYQYGDVKAARQICEMMGFVDKYPDLFKTTVKEVKAKMEKIVEQKTRADGAHIVQWGMPAAGFRRVRRRPVPAARGE